MLILCGELGGKQPQEQCYQYLRRLIYELIGQSTKRLRQRIIELERKYA